MKWKTAVLKLVMASTVVLSGGTMFAQQPSATLRPNETQGFGDSQLLRFIYTQNFDCVDQPQDDLDYNGVPAESDPGEFQTPINQDIKLPSIWWQVIPVLVLQQSDWPSQDGSTGITSYKAICAAEKAGTAVQAPSNFFLFFSSRVMKNMKM
jgi:hypothetical protein